MCTTNHVEIAQDLLESKLVCVIVNVVSTFKKEKT